MATPSEMIGLFLVAAYILILSKKISIEAGMIMKLFSSIAAAKYRLERLEATVDYILCHSLNSYASWSLLLRGARQMFGCMGIKAGEKILHLDKDLGCNKSMKII